MEHQDELTEEEQEIVEEPAPAGNGIGRDPLEIPAPELPAGVECADLLREPGTAIIDLRVSREVIAGKIRPVDHALPGICK